MSGVQRSPRTLKEPLDIHGKGAGITDLEGAPQFKSGRGYGRRDYGESEEPEKYCCT